MEKQKDYQLFAQSFGALTFTTLLSTSIGLAMLYMSRMAIALYYGKGVSLHKAYSINILCFLLLIGAQVIAIINYNYLVKNGLTKETKATKYYAWLSAILFIIVAIAIELFVRA